jgi:hypothetical protein
MYTTPTLIQLAYSSGDVITWHLDQVHLPIFNTLHFTLSVATLALASRPRQKACKGVSQKEAREPKQEEEARESHHKLPGVLESVREYEGMNPHTPKATPTLGDGVPVDS